MTLTTPDPIYPDRVLNTHIQLTSECAGQKRAVVLVPPLGGLTWADRFLAWRLRRAGAFVVSLVGFSGDAYVEDDWRVHDRGLRRGRAAVERVIEWVRDQGCEHVSLVGASMGGLFAVAHADVDRTALIVAGASCADIAAGSRLPRLRALKRQRRQRDHLSESGYLRRLHASFTRDLDQIVKPEAGRRDLVVIAENDQIVPTRTQWRLARWLRPARILRVRGGHILTILVAELFMTGRLVRHLTR